MHSTINYDTKDKKAGGMDLCGHKISPYNIHETFWCSSIFFFNSRDQFLLLRCHYSLDN